MAAAPTPPEAGVITVSNAAKLLMLESDRRVQQLVAEGWIQKDSRGRYLTVAVVQGYIRFLKEQLKERNQNTHTNRLSDSRARSIEVKTAKDEHELVEFDEVAALVDEIAGTLRSELMGFGASMTRDTTMRKKIDAGIDAVFARTQARIVEALKALAESGEIVEADSEDDAA